MKLLVELPCGSEIWDWPGSPICHGYLRTHAVLARVVRESGITWYVLDTSGAQLYKLNTSQYGKLLERHRDKVPPIPRIENEALDIVEDLVRQHCHISEEQQEAEGLGYELDSMGISDNADAMRLLARAGRLEIVDEAGRRVLANWRK